MALRSQAIFVCLVFAPLVSAADFEVRHVHLRHDQLGTLSISSEGIAFHEAKPGKRPHDFRWTWEDIERLTLFPDRLEITTYKDVRWQLGRDGEFAFTGKELDAAYPLLQGRLPRRLVLEVARTEFAVAQRIPAKRLEGRGGYEGTLLFGPGHIVFESLLPRGSHTWVLDEVDNISSSDPLELTVSSLGSDYRFQLKQRLPDDLYQGLWRAVNLRR